MHSFENYEVLFIILAARRPGGSGLASSIYVYNNDSSGREQKNQP
jgi:hypothetical protein